MPGEKKKPDKKKADKKKAPLRDLPRTKGLSAEQARDITGGDEPPPPDPFPTKSDTTPPP
jgi:hypothetical protein